MGAALRKINKKELNDYTLISDLLARALSDQSFGLGWNVCSSVLVDLRLTRNRHAYPSTRTFSYGSYTISPSSGFEASCAERRKRRARGCARGKRMFY